MFNTFTIDSITEKDKEDFPYHTENSIIGIKVIRAISNDVLLDLADDEDQMITLQQHIGTNTNYYWVVGRVADELYNRGLIGHEDYDSMVD